MERAIVLQVNVDVPDLERGVAFYRDAFGLTLRRRLFGGAVAELSGAPCPFFLLQKDDGSAAAGAARRDYTRHWTPVHLELVVPDVERAVARAVAAGARLEDARRRLRRGRGRGVVSVCGGSGKTWCR